MAKLATRSALKMRHIRNTAGSNPVIATNCLMCGRQLALKKHFGLSPPKVGHIPTKSYSGSTPGQPARKRAGHWLHSEQVEKDRNKYLRQQIYCSDRFQGWAYLGGCVFRGEGCATFSRSYENVAKLVRLPTFNRKIEGSSPSILTIIRALSSVGESRSLINCKP